MNRSDTARCYALVCGAYSTPPDEVNVEAWHLLLRHLDAELALEATRRLCLRDSPFPPRPGEIAAEAKRIAGDNPPSIEAALSFYVTGNPSVHPLVKQAADRCYLNPARDNFEQARFEFRDAYSAVLYEAEEAEREPSRQALGVNPPRAELAKPMSWHDQIVAEHERREREETVRDDDVGRLNAKQILADLRAKRGTGGQSAEPDPEPL